MLTSLCGAASALSIPACCAARSEWVSATACLKSSITWSREVERDLSEGAVRRERGGVLLGAKLISLVAIFVSTVKTFDKSISNIKKISDIYP